MELYIINNVTDHLGIFYTENHKHSSSIIITQVLVLFTITIALTLHIII